MEPKIILLIAGIIFILIAVVGGGFEIKEIKIPEVPKWARFVSALLGIVFCGFFAQVYLVTTMGPISDKEKTTYENKELVIYEDNQSDVSVHSIKLLRLSAKSPHNPPRVNDRITIEFTLQNISNSPIELLESYVTAYDPFEENNDCGWSNKRKNFLPQQIIKTKGSLIVDVPGTWQFGPSYAVGENDEEALYPGSWRRFTVLVVE